MVAGKVSKRGMFINLEAVASKTTWKIQETETMMGQVPKETERDSIKPTGRGRY